MSHIDDKLGPLPAPGFTADGWGGSFYTADQLRAERARGYALASGEALAELVRLQIELKELQAYHRRVEDWQRGFEHMVNRRWPWQAMFDLGAWWADRPWRTREPNGPVRMEPTA